MSFTHRPAYRPLVWYSPALPTGGFWRETTSIIIHHHHRRAWHLVAVWMGRNVLLFFFFQPTPRLAAPRSAQLAAKVLGCILEATRLPNLIVLVILGYTPGYTQSIYPGTPRAFTRVPPKSIYPGISQSIYPGILRVNTRVLLRVYTRGGGRSTYPGTPESTCPILNTPLSCCSW